MRFVEADLTRQCGCERRHDGFRTLETGERVHKACGRPRDTIPMLRGIAVPPVPYDEYRTPTVTNKHDIRPTVQEDTMIVTETIAFNIDTVNLDDLDPRVIGQVVIDSLKAKRAETMPAKAEAVVKQRTKKAKVERVAKQADRKDLSSIGVLEGFTLHGVEVPALDVSDVPTIDEVPAAKFRSPYNRIRCRMTPKEGLLPHSNDDDMGVKACTWATLVNDHQRFAAIAAGVTPAQAEHVKLLTTDTKDVEKAPKKRKKQPEPVLLAAEFNLDEKVAIKALRAEFGVTKAEAKAMLASIS